MQSAMASSSNLIPGLECIDIDSDSDRKQEASASVSSERVCGAVQKDDISGNRTEEHTREESDQNHLAHRRKYRRIDVDVTPVLEPWTDLHSYTVQVLRRMSKEKHTSSSGLKQDLVGFQKSVTWLYFCRYICISLYDGWLTL